MEKENVEIIKRWWWDLRCNLKKSQKVLNKWL